MSAWSISQKPHVQTTKFLKRVACSCGWVAVQRRCDTLYTSGFEMTSCSHMARHRHANRVDKQVLTNGEPRF